ncbi:MAG: PhzF family phenazine biosynthesis protein [Cyanobacteria bacterium P01_A01_bin.135]
MQLYQVDAFTNRPFAGNPAAVCLVPSPQPEAWMQQVAQEMNLSETAFVQRLENLSRSGAHQFNLRWFTPTTEVDLCGHATLASAHVLLSEGYLPEDAAIEFQTRSGPLTARSTAAGIELNFPATPVPAASAPPGLLDALGITAAPEFVGKSRFDYLIEVASEAQVRQMQPNFRELRHLPVRGIIVTSRGESSSSAGDAYDMVSRFFAPGSGIDEDPVTGSAHCALGPFWQSRLGKAELLAYQASPRGGELRLLCQGDRVLLRGRAVTVLKGELSAADGELP